MVPSAMPSRVASSSCAPPTASRSSRSPAVSVGRIGLGDDAEHRPGVHAGLEPEGAGPGDVVTGPDGRLHRAAPRQAGQQGEVQVDPAVRRDRQDRRRQQRAVGDDGGRLGREIGELRPGTPRSSRSAGVSTAMPGLAREFGDRGRGHARPRPRRAGGRVMTAATSCSESSSAASDGTAAAGVPAKTMRRGSCLPVGAGFASRVDAVDSVHRQRPGDEHGSAAGLHSRQAQSRQWPNRVFLGGGPSGRRCLTAKRPGRSTAGRCHRPAGPDGGRRRTGLFAALDDPRVYAAGFGGGPAGRPPTATANGRIRSPRRSPTSRRAAAVHGPAASATVRSARPGPIVGTTIAG